VAKRNYRQMLADLDVNEFSRFEKFAPKMDSDPRYGHAWGFGFLGNACFFSSNLAPAGLRSVRAP
jgi:hypothetical protein